MNSLFLEENMRLNSRIHFFNFSAEFSVCKAVGFDYEKIIKSLFYIQCMPGMRL